MSQNLDYPAAARAIYVWLKEFCDENLCYPDMIAEAARRAAKHIEKQNETISKIKALINSDETPQKRG